jgi:hypothetical protein
MNHPLTLCCAICIFGQTAGLGQNSNQATAESPAQGDLRPSADWTVFSHVLGFEFPVPPGFKPVGKPETSSTAKFVSPDESFAITAHAVISSSPLWVLESNWRQTLKPPGRSISYQRKDGSGFVISGFDRNGTEFYQKFIMEGNKVVTMTLTYPHSRTREFHSWVSAIQESFRIVPPPPPPRDITQCPDPSPMVDLTPPKSLRNPTASVNVALSAAENPVPGGKTIPENSPAKEPPPQEARLPYGVPVEGKPGFVYSPYGSKQIVDVVDLSPGLKVRCPYTKRLFRVP